MTALELEDDGPWWHRAKCATIPDYLADHGPKAQRRVCATCPVRLPCLEEALEAEANDPALPDVGWPVRGGLLGEERRKLILDAGTRNARHHRHVTRSDREAS